jgi:hypothetical protein
MPEVQAGRSIRRYTWLAFLTALFPLLTPLYGRANPTVARLLESLKNNVVSITATRSDGSEQQGFGFIVGATRGLLYIVTANHVVRGEGPEGLSTRVTLRYFYDQGVTYQAKLLGTSSNERDLAVLTTETPAGFTWRQDALSSGEQVEWGTDVWFVGRNGRWDAPAIAGKVTEVNLSDQIVVDNLPVQPGTSGAPLISQHGIIGMIVSDAPGDVSRALTIDFIHKALKTWNHPWEIKPLMAKPLVATPRIDPPPPARADDPGTASPSPTPPPLPVTGKLCLRLSRDVDSLVEFIVSGPDQASSVVYAGECANLKPGKYDIKVSTLGVNCQSTSAEVKVDKTNNVQVRCGLSLRLR